jgi:multidrug transporter EmrE-like cation transporter
MGALVLGHLPIAIIAIAFVPVPEAASWPYIIAGIALHMGYQLFLLQSYKIGDLTQVYPIARGSAPLIVTVVSVVFLGIALTTMQLAAVALIGLGILTLALALALALCDGRMVRKIARLRYSPWAQAASSRHIHL